MSGPRYTGWHHTRIVGDRDAGSVYLPEARTLLGYVMDEAERNQLGVHSARRELKDGTVIIAEKHGAIPRVTITPAGSEGEEIKLQVPSDFVVWARDAGHPAGIDAEHPQQILRAKKAKPAGTAGGNGGIHAAEGGGAAADVSWQTFFFNSDVDGYEDFALAKGTYGGLFPGGVPRAGNVDWCGEDGERISWYGPSSRYFFDVFHQPRSQYDKKVFMQGRVILDVDDYLAHSPHDAGFTEHYVLGAALRKDSGTWWLYVAQADLPTVATSTATIPANTIFFGESLPQADVSVRINRYAMLTSDAHPAIELSAANNGREALWAGVITSGVQPWIFDAACERAVTFAANTNATATTSTYVPGLAGAPGETDVWYSATLTIDEDNVASATVTTATVSQTGGNKATLARDFKGGAAVDLLVSRSTQFNTPAAPVLSLGGASWPLHYREAIAGGYRYFKRWLLHADLREGEVLFFVQDVTVPDDVNVALSGETWVELWRGGARITSIQALGGAVTTTGLPQAVATLVDASLSDLYNRASGYALAPSWFVYGQVGYAYGTTVGGAFAGIAPMFALVWPPASELYGSYGARATTPGAPTTVASQRDASFADNSADFDGHTSAISCATVDNVTVFSVPAFAAGNDASLSFADDSPLGALTGVAGANARYHPIWLLGQPLPEAA